jgi:hypothetical protein
VINSCACNACDGTIEGDLQACVTWIIAAPYAVGIVASTPTDIATVGMAAAVGLRRAAIAVTAWASDCKLNARLRETTVRATV